MKSTRPVRVTEAARRLGVSGQSIRNWIKSGVLPASQPKRAFLIPRHIIEAIERGETPIPSRMAVDTLQPAVDRIANSIAKA